MIRHLATVVLFIPFILAFSPFYGPRKLLTAANIMDDIPLLPPISSNESNTPKLALGNFEFVEVCNRIYCNHKLYIFILFVEASP